MANDSKRPEEKFLELGESLASQPSSADELYSLLDEMASSLRSTSKAPSADQSYLENSAKPKSRRKRPLKTKDIPETPNHKKDVDEQLVGSKIKVWRPDDNMFYDGVVDSYDPATKKHKIVYAHGDIEVLLLEDERWEHVESDSEKDGGKQIAEGSASQIEYRAISGKYISQYWENELNSAKPKSRRKRPRPLKTKDIPETPNHKKDLDEQLVGSKIKVWWPDDNMFYDGVVDSYDPVTKNHKIVYADDDIEVLLLEEERWEHVESDSEKDGGRQIAEESASQMSHSKKAKASLNAASMQAKLQRQSKSGRESSSKGVQRPRGRPWSGTPSLGKLSYNDTTGTSKKSKGSSSDDKVGTPRYSGKLDEPEIESKVETPRTSSKQEESSNRSKDGTSKRGNVRDEPPKSSRKSKNKTLEASTKAKDDLSRVISKSGDDSSKSKDSTPKTANRSEIDVVSKNEGLKTKPKIYSTPKSSGDSKANDVSSKGKTKVGNSGTTSGHRHACERDFWTPARTTEDVSAEEESESQPMETEGEDDDTFWQQDSPTDSRGQRSRVWGAWKRIYKKLGEIVDALSCTLRTEGESSRQVRGRRRW